MSLRPRLRQRERTARCDRRLASPLQLPSAPHRLRRSAPGLTPPRRRRQRHDQLQLIASTRPGAGREGEVVEVARGLARGAGRAATPLLVVGGASPLRIAGTAHSALEDPRFVPEHIRPLARASTRHLEVLQEYPDTDWTYLAPAAHFAPGPRTARYRITDGELVIGADGKIGRASCRERVEM